MTPDQIKAQREVYETQLKALRKQWAADYKAEQQRISDEKAALVKRMILQKAMNLREKKAIAVKKAEAQRVLHAKIRNNYEAHVARLTVLENQKNELRKQRFSRLVEMLSAESKYWITPENVNQRITIDLFLRPATTGVITGVSEHWRYYCPSMQPNRVIQQLLGREELNSDDEEFYSDYEEEEADDENIEYDETQYYRSAVDYLAESEPYITKQKENIKGMLNAMIGTGDDRSKYDELVKDFIALSETYNGPMTNLGRAGVFASDEPPDISKLSKQDFTQFFSDPDDPVLTARMKKEVDQLWSNKNALKDGNLSEDEIAYRAQNSSDSPPSITPDLSDDSDEEIIDDEDEIPGSEEKFAVAESQTIDDLIEDVDYIDENNINEVRKLYEKILLKSSEME